MSVYCIYMYLVILARRFSCGALSRDKCPMSSYMRLLSLKQCDKMAYIRLHPAVKKTAGPKEPQKVEIDVCLNIEALRWSRVEVG